MCGRSMEQGIRRMMIGRKRVVIGLPISTMLGRTKATAKVVESSSKENVETEKHIPPVGRFKVHKHIQPRHLLYYLRSS